MQEAIDNLKAKESIWLKQFHPNWRIPVYAGLGIALAFFLYSVIGWLRPDENNAPVGVYVPAKVSKQISNVPKVDLMFKKPIKVYAPAAKKKLKLPDPIQQDDNQQVIASSQVKNDDHPHTITTIINKETGESETIVRTDPLPWIDFDKRGSVGMYYGFKDSQAAVRLQIQQDIVDIKSIRVGAIASVDQYTSSPTQRPADWYIGVGLRYSW